MSISASEFYKWMIVFGLKNVGPGGGDVVGPGVATNNAVSRFDGVSGKLIKNSVVTIDDSGNIVTPGGADLGIPLAPDSGGTGTADVPSLSQILVGNSTDTWDLADIVGAGGITTSYNEGLKQLTITATAGGGDVLGPASSTDDALVRFDGLTGKLIKDSTVTLDDSGNISTDGSITITNVAGGKLNIPNLNAAEVFVSLTGSDSNNGQIVQPFRNVIFADIAASIGSSVFVAPGAYTGGAFLKTVGVGLYGSSPQDCSFTSSGLLGIGNAQWIVATAPKFSIQDITLAGTSTSYFPSVYVANSSQTFSNVVWPSNSFVGGGVTNLAVIKGCQSQGITVHDTATFILDGGDCFGDFNSDSIDSASVPVITIRINNYDFHGNNINLVTGLSGGDANYAVIITNCRNINTLTYDDQSFVATSTLSIDANSWPTLLQDLTGGGLTVTRITNVADAIDTTKGFALQSISFSWTANIGSTSYTFTAGEGAHPSSGSGNILLGKYSTASKNGCFVWSDNTSTILDNLFPELDNQAVFQASGGFGIGTLTTGGVKGPQAGFDYNHGRGNDGKFLFSAAGIVADANMLNSKLNPYITADQLFIKQKGATGTISLYTFPSGGGTIPSLTALQTTNTLKIGDSVAPNITSATTQDVVVIGSGAGAALPNAPTNQSRSTFIGNLCGAAYTTSGSANDQHVGVGYFALRTMTTAQFNTAVGGAALRALTTANSNAALGNSAGENLTSGSGQNVLAGSLAGQGAGGATYSNTVAIGYNSGVVMSSGFNNTLVGYNSGTSLSSGSQNVLIGSSCNLSSGSGTNRIGIGHGVTVSNNNQAVIGNSSLTSVISNSSSATLGTSANPWAGASIVGITSTAALAAGVNPLITLNVASYNATSGSTITATDFATGAITVNPSAPQTITTPTASDLDAYLVSVFGTVPVSSAIKLVYFNQSAFTSTITAGSGITFTRGGSSTIVAALSTAEFTIFKNTSGPAYLAIGN